MVSRKLLSEQQSSVALKVALRVIRNWRATPVQTCSILRISRSTFRRASQGVDAGRRLDLDQQQRLGMVLGIHASLRAVFDNPANVQGFLSLKNDNPFFEGRSPIEIMASGDIIALYETYKRIAQFPYAQY